MTSLNFVALRLKSSTIFGSSLQCPYSHQPKNLSKQIAFFPTESLIPFSTNGCISSPLLAELPLIIESKLRRYGTRRESARVLESRRRKKYNGTREKPRLSVFGSGDHLYAMLVDDRNKKTLFYRSTLHKSIRGDPPCETMEAAKRVGEEVVKACENLKIGVISSYDLTECARDEKVRAFEVPVSMLGILPDPSALIEQS